jgi:SPP1 gp7 family putative phage head morphogenesis protein
VAFNSGVTSIDEYRQALGYDALPDGIGARYKRKAVEDYVTLEEIANPPEPEPQPSPPQFAPPAEDTDSGAIEPPGRDEMPADEETPKGAIATREKAVIAANNAVPFGSSEHAAIAKAFDDRIAPREDALERDVIAWGDDLRDAVLGKLEPFKSLKASVPDAEAVLFDVDEAGNALWKTVRGAALEAAIAEGKQVLGEIALRLPNAGDLFFDRENPRVIAHLRDKELKVKTVARTLHDDLRARIVNGERAGKPISEIADDLQARFGHLNDYQARRIAQTEIVGASNIGAAAAIELAELGKEWIATLDDRVRDSHARLHGNVVGADETFANGLLHPGDANGPAEEVINCRCSVAAVIPED